MNLTELNKFKHDVKTYLNHIIGFSEILQEDASDLGKEKILSMMNEISRDVEWLKNYCLTSFEDSLISTDYSQFKDLAKRKIQDLNLSFSRIKTVCFDSKDQDCFLTDVDNIINSLKKLDTLIKETQGFSVNPKKEPQTTALPSLEKNLIGNILVVDDNVINRKLLQRKLEKLGHSVRSASSGEEGLSMLVQDSFDLVILDLMMPGISGFDVLKKIKTNRETRVIPVIMNSALDDMNSIVRCIELGAEDYLPKDVNLVLLKARIDACLEKKIFRQQEYLYMKTLLDSQDLLARELGEAADYVLSLLPADDDNSYYTAESLFHPSAQLGGDCLDHFRIDENTSVFYLLDVSGHGIGAALLSISVMNVLRSGTLPGTDFKKPEEVLLSLNNVFKMEQQNNMFFSIWYGVYNNAEKRLSFSSAGSPPGFLKTSTGEVVELFTPNLIIGADEKAIYVSEEVVISPGNSLYLFSDGIYEAASEEKNQIIGLERFKDIVKEFEDKETLTKFVEDISQISKGESFDDDITMLRTRFK